MKREGPILEKFLISMMLIALLAVLLPALQTAAAQTTSTMQSDLDRLVQAAEKLAGTWPSQPPPAVPEVALVARHGKAVVPLLMVLLSDDPRRLIWFPESVRLWRSIGRDCFGSGTRCLTTQAT